MSKAGRTPLAELHDKLTVAGHDTNWLTEKALAHVKAVQRSAYDGTREVEARRARIGATLQAVPGVISVMVQTITHQTTQIREMREQTIEAVKGLLMFLEVLNTYEMSAEAHDAITAQIDAVRMAMVPPTEDET